MVRQSELKRINIAHTQTIEDSGLLAAECHIRCGDCGRLLPKSEWVPLGHLWKKHALCCACKSGYDDCRDH